MMKIRKKKVHFLAVCTVTAFFCSQKVYGLFTYDRAAYAAQKGNWPYANSLLNQLVVDDPKNPALVYDAGVAAYKLKDFKQAESYFSAAQQAAAHDKALQDKALFNQGNACAQQKKFKEAIESYERALKIKPDDAHAQHNLELIKKLLEQEEQKKKQEQEQKDKKQQEQDKKQNQQNKDDGAQSQQQQSSDKDNEKQEKGEQDNKNNNADESKADDQNKKKKQQEGQEKADKNQEKNNNDKETQSQQSDAAEERQSGQQQAREQRAADDLSTKIDAHLAELLDQREQRDGQLNKQFIKAQVGKQLTGHHGQNCW